MVYPYVDPDRTEPADSVVEVGVDPVHRIISYTIVDGKITLANVASALNADTTFRRLFTARAVTSSSTVGVLDIDEASGRRLSGGFSTVGVRVRFTDHVGSVAGAAAFTAPASFTSLFLDGRDASDAGVTVRCLRRGPVVYLEYIATDDALVPLPGNPVRVPSGYVTNFASKDNLAQRSFNLRFDASVPAQFGYEVEQLAGDADGQQCEGTS